MADLYDELKEALEHDRPCALATVIRGPGLGGKRLIFGGFAPVVELRK